MTITIDSNDVNDGIEGSFPGISFDTTFVADGSYGWTGAPIPSLTGQDFEVRIRPNCGTGTLSGVTWDSNGGTSLPQRELSITDDMAATDAAGLRSQTVFDERFG